MIMTKGFQGSSSVKVAVCVGGHPYDVPAFQGWLGSMPGIDCYVQDLENLALDAGQVLAQYDVFMFYNMHTKNLAIQENAAKRINAFFERLGESSQGILVLHHALLAFPTIPCWAEICGIQDRTLRSYAGGEIVRTEIANVSHPITKGLSAWEMTDELYLMNDAGAGSDILLTTNHPKSMSTLGWARQYRKARVFCYASGHDNATYTNPMFQTVMSRALQWLAGRI
jgi:uncharacterized protein